MIHVTFLLKRHYLAEHHSWHFLSCCSFRRGISGSFFLSLLFSRSQVIIKKSSNDNCLGSNRGLRENIIKHQTLSFWTDKIIIWWLFNDGFRAREGEWEEKGTTNSAPKCSFYFSKILELFASTRYENRCEICEGVKKWNNNLVLVPKMLKNQKNFSGCRGITSNLCAITKIQGDF